jgi:hypothetical protein
MRLFLTVWQQHSRMSTEVPTAVTIDATLPTRAAAVSHSSAGVRGA